MCYSLAIGPWLRAVLKAHSNRRNEKPYICPRMAAWVTELHGMYSRDYRADRKIEEHTR